MRTSLQREIRIGLVIVGAALGGFILWAGTVPLDEGVPAQGKLVVESQRKRIEHLTGGIVGSIRVKEGQRVRVGDELLVLDETQSGAALRAAEQQWWASLAVESRLEAELAGSTSLRFPQELQSRRDNPLVSSIIAAEQETFRTRRAAFAGEIGIMRGSQAGLEQQLRSLDALRSGRERQVSLLSEQMTAASALREQGYVSRNQALEVERQLVETQSRQGEDLASITATQARLAELRLRESQYRVDHRRDLEALMSDARRDSAMLAEKVAALRDTHSRLSIRAPVSGTVVDLAVTTVGGVVRAGDRVMDIVPDGDELVVEARLDPRFVDRVRPGLPADLHFDAYMNLAMRPLVTGEVKVVSADVMTDERSGAPYYTLRVAIPASERARLGDVQLQPGMLCSVMVKTGEHTLMAYLARPLLRRFSGALSEA